MGFKVGDVVIAKLTHHGYIEYTRSTVLFVGGRALSHETVWVQFSNRERWLLLETDLMLEKDVSNLERIIYGV